MINKKPFDDLAKALFKTLPENFAGIEKEMESKFKSVLQAAFNRMDLVTREEFDVQTKVLARTREKLEALQAQVDALKQQKIK